MTNMDSRAQNIIILQHVQFQALLQVCFDKGLISKEEFDAKVKALSLELEAKAVQMQSQQILTPNSDFIPTLPDLKKS